MYFAVVNGKSILIFGTRYVKVIFDVKFEKTNLNVFVNFSQFKKIKMSFAIAYRR